MLVIDNLSDLLDLVMNGIVDLEDERDQRQRPDMCEEDHITSILTIYIRQPRQEDVSTAPAFLETRGYGYMLTCLDHIKDGNLSDAVVEFYKHQPANVVPTDEEIFGVQMLNRSALPGYFKDPDTFKDDLGAIQEALWNLGY